MIQQALLDIEALRQSGRHEDAHRLAVQLVETAPDDIRARIAAAYTSDRLGLDQEAIVHYDRAWGLGVPPEQRGAFLLGYGSSLRNVGRHQEAVERLREAVHENPDSPPLLAFLSLTLLGAGYHTAAVAKMLRAALAAAKPDAFQGYERSLREYLEELDTGT